MAFKGKILNNSSHLSLLRASLSSTVVAFRAGEQVGVHCESRNPAFTDFPDLKKQLGPHHMSKWDTHLPNPQNRNIAQLNSFSTLVALKEGDRTQLIEFEGVDGDNFLAEA